MCLRFLPVTFNNRNKLFVFLGYFQTCINCTIKLSALAHAPLLFVGKWWSVCVEVVARPGFALLLRVDVWAGMMMCLHLCFCVCSADDSRMVGMCM